MADRRSRRETKLKMNRQATEYAASAESVPGVYGVFDKQLLILCELEDMADHIGCFMKRLAIPADIEVAPSVRLAILRGSNDGQAIFLSPEADLMTKETLGRRAWARFRHFFRYLVLGSRAGLYPLHASCVADESGKAALIVGSSSAGKTSTMLALLQRGYRFVCDDCGLFDLDSGNILALPVGATVTTATCERFPELLPLRSDACKFYWEDQWQWTMNPGDVYPAARAYAPYNPTHFFFLTPAFGSESRLELCASDEAMWLFQEGRFYTKRFSLPLGNCEMEYRRKCFETARDLCSRAAFYRLINGDVEQSADLIAEAFEGDR